MKAIIKNIKDFGTVNSVGVHQVLETEEDIYNAYHNAGRDGFERIYFYVSYPSNWMTNHDFVSLVWLAKSYEASDV